jgi:hypothetical protein
MDEQYHKYREIVKTITKNDDRCDDLLHDILIDLTKNEKYNALSPKDKVYFFIRVVKNQFYSNNSKYQRTYKKYVFQEFNPNVEIPDEAYKEPLSMEWVHKTLDNELDKNKEFWYNYGLFNLYLEHKKIETIHQKTQIPKYSIRNTIKEMKAWIKIKWIEYQNE